MSAQLNAEEINTLIAALNVWKETTVTPGEVIGKVFTCTSPEEAMRKIEEVRAEAKTEQRRREEVAIMLQAKLLVMRSAADKIDMQAISDALRDGKL